MATDRPRRQFIVLGVLLVGLAGLIVYNLDGSQQAAAPASNAPRPQRGRQAPATTAEALDLRIESLSQAKPAPEESIAIHSDSVRRLRRRVQVAPPR